MIGLFSNYAKGGNRFFVGRLLLQRLHETKTKHPCLSGWACLSGRCVAMGPAKVGKATRPINLLISDFPFGPGIACQATARPLRRWDLWSRRLAQTAATKRLDT
jgi:hypothetical protein